MEEALRLSLEILGETHPHSIRAMVRLASVWRNQGRYDNAEAAVAKAFENSKDTHGERPPVTLAVMRNLARTTSASSRNAARQRRSHQ